MKHSTGLMNPLYSHSKFFAFPDQISALRARQVTAPVHVRIKPTNICNHDCWYCAYHVSGLQLASEMVYRDQMPKEKLVEIAEDLIAIGTQAVTFSGGGEPLLYKTLPDVIQRLATGGIKVASLTNGANLKGNIADAFAQYGTWIRISLDGYDDVSYSKARGVPDGAFTKLLENIRKFTSRSTKCMLGTVFIIDAKNFNHIYDTCSLLKDSGVSHIKLSGVIVGNSPQENNKYHSTIKKVVTAAIKSTEQLCDDQFSIINAYHDLEERSLEKPYTMCPNLLFRPVIGADCNVYTCQDKAYTPTGLLGSIKETSFREFWFSEQNKEKLYSFDPSVSCNHHCVANQGNLNALSFLSLDEDHLPFT